MSASRIPLASDVEFSLETLPSPPPTSNEGSSPLPSDLAARLALFLAPPARPGDLGRLGEYHIRGILGTGGMGVVLAADDDALGRPVAIKLIRPDVAASTEAQRRFLREARAAAAVAHPRVVIIHQVGEWNGAPFLVMPLMAGRSLGARLRDSAAPIPLAAAVRFVRETAEGLAAAHARGLTHRDIKPDNLWLEETFEGTHVRILDFGLARGDEAGPLTASGAVVGTPHYMAPEQAAGERVDGRADLFSLGCVLYELLTGQRPFTGSSVMSVLNALANHHPPPPRDVAPHVPASLSELAMRLLEKSPDGRPATAEEVADELWWFEANRPPLAETIARAPQSSTDAPPSEPANCAQQAIPHKAGEGDQPGSRRRLRRGVAAAIVALLAISPFVFNQWLTDDRGTPPRSDPGNSSAENPVGSSAGNNAATPQNIAQRVTVTSIDIVHFENTPEGDVPRGLLGQRTYSAFLGDRVQVTAKLSRPAYAYLIAFRPDGAADLCFPDDENTPPPLTDAPRYPLSDGRKAYGLREGAGLWAFAVVASEKPLPAWRDAKDRIERELDWAPIFRLPPGIVWWDDGVDQVQQFTESGRIGTLRGKDESLEGPARAILNLTESLREATHADAASTLGFRVVPND